MVKYAKCWLSREETGWYDRPFRFFGMPADYTGYQEDSMRKSVKHRKDNSRRKRKTENTLDDFDDEE